MCSIGFKSRIVTAFNVLVVDAVGKGPIHLRHEDDRGSRFGLGGFDSVRGEHIVYFLFLEFSLLRTGRVWGWFIGKSFSFSRSIRCCSALTDRRRPSHIFSN